MPWPQILLYLALGFFLLDRGADWLVHGGSRLARLAGLSPFVVGITVVAWGTSLPEVVVSGLAAARGYPEMALGNIVGSNIANIGLVLGVSGLILPIIVQGRLPLRDGAWLLGSLGVLAWVLSDGAVTYPEAAAMLLLMGAYTLQALRSARTTHPPAAVDEDDRHPVVHVVAGMLGISAGAWLVTTGGAEGALRLGVPGRVVGLTVFAVGTSLPELVTSIKGALRGECEIALGNVVGSNVFNSLAVLGVVGLIKPFSAGPVGGEAHQGFEKVLQVDLPVAAAFSVALLLLPRLAGGRRARPAALFLLLAVLGYFSWLFAAGLVPPG